MPVKQRKLKLGPTPTSDRKCAEIIKADPVKYPGRLMQEWAERVLAGDTSKPNADRVMSLLADLKVKGL